MDKKGFLLKLDDDLRQTLSVEAQRQKTNSTEVLRRYLVGLQKKHKREEYIVFQWDQKQKQE